MEDSMIVTPQRSSNAQNPLLVPFILLLLILVAGASYIVGSKNPINLISEATPEPTQEAVLGTEEIEATPTSSASATPSGKPTPTSSANPFKVDSSLLKTAVPLQIPSQ